jgi:hypothetical protein
MAAPSEGGSPRRHPRYRALAELARLIARAEAARELRLAAGGWGTGTADAARAEVLLDLAEELLADLRRSRAALLADEGRAADDLTPRRRARPGRP